MAVTVANLTVNGSETDATSYETASITPSANKLVLATFRARGVTNPQPTLSGCGMTWVVVLDVQASSVDRLTMFRGMSASPSSGVLTISYGTDTQLRCNWVVDEFTGMDTTGTNGSGAIVQSASASSDVSVTTLTATLAAFGDVGNATYGAFSVGDNEAFTPGTGFTQVGTFSAVNNSNFSEFKDTNDTSVDASWSVNSSPAEAIAVEIKAAVAPGAAGPSGYKSLLGVGQA